MSRRTLVIALMIAALLPLLVVTVVSAQGGGDPARGKELWTANNCKSCHGDNGEGKYAGPRAGDGLTAAQYINQARNPRSRMPAYAVSQVSDAAITDMWAYLQTLPKPASFTATTLPTQATDPQGKVLFAQNRCAACHGDGAGLVKARFTDQGRQVDAAAVLKQLRTPASRMPMFRANQVSDADAGLIAQYLASLQTAPAAQATAAAPAAPAAQATAAPAAQGTAAPAAAATRAPAAPATLPTTGAPLGLLPLALGGLAALGAGLGLAFRARR